MIARASERRMPRCVEEGEDAAPHHADQAVYNARRCLLMTVKTSAGARALSLASITP